MKNLLFAAVAVAGLATASTLPAQAGPYGWCYPHRETKVEVMPGGVRWFVVYYVTRYCQRYEITRYPVLT